MTREGRESVFFFGTVPIFYGYLNWDLDFRISRRDKIRKLRFFPNLTNINVPSLSLWYPQPRVLLFRVCDQCCRRMGISVKPTVLARQCYHNSSYDTEQVEEHRGLTMSEFSILGYSVFPSSVSPYLGGATVVPSIDRNLIDYPWNIEVRLTSMSSTTLWNKVKGVIRLVINDASLLRFLLAILLAPDIIIQSNELVPVLTVYL